MYKKELKARFRKFVKSQAKLASMIDDIDTCMWNCICYFSGLNDAIYISEKYDSYMTPFTFEKFGYIFMSLVEYRKGCTNMTAAQYAITTRPTMGCASEQLLQDYQDGKLEYHHDALVTGYTSVKGDEFASYDGRFGRGVVVFSNYTTAYSKVSYYLEVE